MKTVTRFEGVTDAEALDVMKDGGLRLCDNAIERWESGAYTAGYGEEEARALIRENVWRWKSIRDRVRLIHGWCKEGVRRGGGAGGGILP